MLIYSIKPEETYSKRLLGFGYAKPLFSVVLFVVVLIALQQIIKLMVNLDIPVLGSATSVLPQSTTYGTTVTVLMSADLQWPFYLAVVAAALCLAARLYHKKIAPPMATPPASPPTSTSTSPTPSL
jgi:predicted permease